MSPSATKTIKEQITKETWTQKYSAVDSNGKEVDIFSEEARAWCWTGWMKKVYGHPHCILTNLPVWNRALNAVNVYPHTYNDSHTYEEVKGVIDKLSD